MLSQVKNLVAKFHNDEDGIEAIQVVMIVAIAAVILIGLLAFYKETIGDYITTKTDELTTEDGSLGG